MFLSTKQSLPVKEKDLNTKFTKVHKGEILWVIKPAQRRLIAAHVDRLPVKTERF
jgi:hypothetical protein